jgi:hypothetical protein
MGRLKGARPDGPEIQLPLYPSKRTQSGHRTVSVSCHNRTQAPQHLSPDSGSIADVAANPAYSSVPRSISEATLK